MALAKWILIVVLFNYTENTSDAHLTDGVTTYLLESCETAIEVNLHKDRPNDIVKIRLFDEFPKQPLKQCRCGIYVQIEEFYKAWITRTLSQRLSNYKVLATLEDMNPTDQCDQFFCVVDDMQRNATTMCAELAENVYSYRFDLLYRRFIPLQNDYFLDMTVAVAYMPYGFDTNGCPSDEFFQCASDSLCIPSRFWCDSISHCSDESDEKNCEDAKRPPTVVVASAEEPDTVGLNGEPITSAEDYSTEEDTESVTADFTPATSATTSTTSTTQKPTTQKPALTTTTKRPSGSSTTAKPAKITTKPTTAKKQSPVTKITAIPEQTLSPSSPPLKTSPKPTKSPMTTTAARTPMETRTATKPMATTVPTISTSTSRSVTTVSMREDLLSKTESATSSSSSTPKASVAVATSSAAPSSMAEKSETSSQTLVHFSFSERPSISIVEKASDREPSASATTPSQSDRAVLQASPGILPPTSGSVEASTGTHERRKELYDIEVVSFDGSNGIGSTVPDVDVKHHAKNSSAEPPYPWSDRYDSRSRNSSAISAKSAPNQWVLVVLCLILVFIYFFL